MNSSPLYPLETGLFDVSMRGFKHRVFAEGPGCPFLMFSRRNAGTNAPCSKLLED